jgi:tetratricopeptide (TPR) repeat protein
MRREERHHLKENPLARAITNVQRALADGGARTIGVVAAVVVVVLIGGGGYFAWQSNVADKAGEQLADALIVLGREVAPPPDDTSEEEWEQPENTFPSEAVKLEAVIPQLLAVAEKYPALPAGITARYEAAAALVKLDRLDDAATHYEQVIAADSGGLHGSMARLGLAETHVLRGDYTSAVALLEPETESEEPAVPVDAVLMRIGRAYELAGQDAEALEAFTRVIDEFPFSIYFSQARQRIDALESSAATSTSG